MPQYKDNEYLEVYISSLQLSSPEPIPFNTTTYDGTVTTSKACSYISLDTTTGRFHFAQKGLYLISYSILCFQNNDGTLDDFKLIDNNENSISSGPFWYLIANQAGMLTNVIYKSFDPGDYFYFYVRANSYLTTGTVRILNESRIFIKKVM